MHVTLPALRCDPVWPDHPKPYRAPTPDIVLRWHCRTATRATSVSRGSPMSDLVPRWHCRGVTRRCLRPRPRCGHPRPWTRRPRVREWAGWQCGVVHCRTAPPREVGNGNSARCRGIRRGPHDHVGDLPTRATDRHSHHGDGRTSHHRRSRNRSGPCVHSMCEPRRVPWPLLHKHSRVHDRPPGNPTAHAPDSASFTDEWGDHVVGPATTARARSTPPVGTPMIPVRVRRMSH